MCAKFQVFIIFRLTGDVTHINKYTNIRVNLRISSAAVHLTWILKKTVTEYDRNFAVIIMSDLIDSSKIKNIRAAEIL